MPLLDRAGWKVDAYLRSEEMAAVPAPLVPLALAETALAERAPGQSIGVDVPNTTAAGALKAIQDDVALIAIQFPAAGDGRGFSLGRALREQGFKGTLRAAGALIPDQFAFALACGFDEVEVDEARAARQPAEQWLAAATSISDSYQAVRDGRRSIFAIREAAA